MSKCNCKDKTQCWEPCGDLGHSEEHVKASEELKHYSFPMSHEACDAFWESWKENGETHKHGYYESTWGAIRAYLEKAAITEDQRSPNPLEEESTGRHFINYDDV